MASHRLTDGTIPEKTTGFADGDLIHVVDVSDLSQNPAGSSFKVKLQNIWSNYFATKISASGGGSIGANVGNSASVIIVGAAGSITATSNGIITDWAIQSAGGDGDITFDIWKAAGAIPTSPAQSIVGAGVKPFLSAQRYRKQAAAFDTLAFSAGDVFLFHVNSASVITWANIQLIYTKTT